MNDTFQNILFGIGSLSVLPIGSVPQLQINTQTDAELLAEDWRMVGQDIGSAIESFNESQKQPKPSPI